MTLQDVDTLSLEALVRFVREREIIRDIEHREGAVLIPAGDQTTALSDEEALSYLRELVRDYLRRTK